MTVRAAAIARWALAIVLILGWWALLRPPALGGSTQLLFVVGDSMEPTLHGGDAVVLRERAGYEVGDTIGYRVDDGQTSGVVIHRVIEVTDDGYLTQGDNVDVRDRWVPDDADVLGAHALTIPRGLEAALLVGNPWVMAASWGTVAALATRWWWRRHDDDAGPEDGDAGPDDGDADAGRVDDGRADDERGAIEWRSDAPDPVAPGGGVTTTGSVSRRTVGLAFVILALATSIGGARAAQVDIGGGDLATFTFDVP